jgi:ubiquitin-protein ligase
LPRARNGRSENSPSRSQAIDSILVSTHQSINPIIHPLPYRNGKVARLPYARPRHANRMLRNNILTHVVDALDEPNSKSPSATSPTAKAAVIATGASRRIAPSKLASPGQPPRTTSHQRRKPAAEVGLQLAATQLSQFFLKPETRQQLNAEPEKLARTIGILCRLARQIHILQKYRDQSAKELGDDHNPELFKRETDETLESIRNTYSAEKPSESPEDPYISHRNFLPKNGYPADPPQILMIPNFACASSRNCAMP